MILNRLTLFLALAATTNASVSSLRASAKNDAIIELDLKLPAEKLHLRLKFAEWKKTFNKEYDSVEEEVERLMIWIENNEYIEKQNKKNLSYKLGHNHFSDLTNEEFQERNFVGKFSPGIKKAHPAKKFPVTEDSSRILQSVGELDWRVNGAVTEVKDQGMCGSCWSFSTTGAIEGASFIKYGQLVSLSEQNLIDCDHVDLGCNGGLMDTAFLFDETSGGLCSEESYPYLALQEDTCMPVQCTPVAGSQVMSFTDVPANDVEALLNAITMQPVSVAVEADTQDFQLYSSGVFDNEECGSQVDHAVLAVGYGTEDGKDYFLIKNSWAETWGDQGYIKLARTSIDPAGTCGVLSLSSYPSV